METGRKRIPSHGWGCCKGHLCNQLHVCSSSRVEIYEMINKSLWMSLHLGCMWFNTAAHLLLSIRQTGRPRRASAHKSSPYQPLPVPPTLKMARPLHLMDISNGLKPSVRFWSRTSGWFLVWKMCHLWSTVANKVSLGVRFILSGGIDWRKGDLRRPLGGLRRGEQARTVMNSSLIIMPRTALPTASAWHSDSHTHKQL